MERIKKAEADTFDRLQAVKRHFAFSERAGRLSGKVAIITGVGSKHGIGRATAFMFAHQGCRHIYVGDISGDIDALVDELSIRFPDVRITGFTADAADPKAIEKICQQALDDERRLDIFFANAGIASRHLLHDIEADTFMNTLRVNTLSCHLAVKYASLAMMKTEYGGKPRPGGSIILTASVAGIRSGAGTIDYSASKAAVISIAQTSCQQLAGTDVRVNAICPGLIETGMTVDTFEAARKRGTAGKIGQLNPLRRYGIPDEIASAAVFLASDESSYVNGIALAGKLQISNLHSRWRFIL